MQSTRIWCSGTILVAFVYIYCLLECFSVWISSVSCRNVGVFSSAIWLVAREPTTLAVFYLHFWWGSLNFVSFRVVNSTVVFWLLLTMTWHITWIFNKNVLFPVDVAACQLFLLPDPDLESTAYWLWGQLEAEAAKQKLALNASPCAREDRTAAQGKLPREHLAVPAQPFPTRASLLLRITSAPGTPSGSLLCPKSVLLLYSRARVPEASPEWDEIKIRYFKAHFQRRAWHIKFPAQCNY